MTTNALKMSGSGSTPSPRRYLALWFPFLPVDRLRRQTGQTSARPDDEPLVLSHRRQSGLVIGALNGAASRHGLRIGQRIADARALLGTLAVGEMDDHADALLLTRIASACEMFTPLVALDGTDGVMLDITGCMHLFDGEQGLQNRCRDRIRRLGMTVLAATACTPNAAHALVRYGPRSSFLPHQEETCARSLPITALELPDETTIGLARAGLRTLDDLDRLPTGALVARFGSEPMTRLRRILGREDIRITPLRPRPDMIADKHFPTPVTASAYLFAALERLAQTIVRLLDGRGEGGRMFEASFYRSDGAVRHLVIETAQPLRDASHIIRLLTLKSESLADPLDPGFGFDAVRLAVLRSEPIALDQITLEPQAHNSTDEREIAELFDRLVARFGRHQVQRFLPCDTHDPVRASRVVPVLSKAQATWTEPEPGPVPLRPLTLFDPPQQIEAIAEVPDGPPLQFRWHRVLHQVARAEGPERIAPEWWRGGNNAPMTRDYYRIENAEGRRFWVFREGLYEDSMVRPRWFVHGLFA